jgi:hypothetical protein
MIAVRNGGGGKRKEARLRYLSRYWMNRLKGEGCGDVGPTIPCCQCGSAGNL